MSVSRSSETDGIDYSDFQYQQVLLQVNPGESNSGGAAQTDVTAALNPLDGIGGLANNEVAELVGHRVSVAFRANDNANRGDQQVGGGFKVQGVLGANADNDDLIPGNFQETGETDVVFNLTTTAAPDTVVLKGISEGRIFEMFQASASLAFDDETNGPGGGQDSNLETFERNWRDVTGRGPVLDQTDDVTLAVRATAWDNVIDSAGWDVFVHLIWDVSETSDAGRAFSVPQ